MSRLSQPRGALLQLKVRGELAHQGIIVINLCTFRGRRKSRSCPLHIQPRGSLACRQLFWAHQRHLACGNGQKNLVQHPTRKETAPPFSSVGEEQCSLWIIWLELHSLVLVRIITFGCVFFSLDALFPCSEFSRTSSIISSITIQTLLQHPKRLLALFVVLSCSF